MNSLHLMTAISFISFMAAGLIGPVNSLYMESLGANYVAIGLLATTASYTTLFSYLWGRASDLIGQRKAFLTLGMLTTAVSYGLIALAPNYIYLFPLRILSGAALSAHGTARLALVGDLLEQQTQTRGRRIGTFRGLGSLSFGIMAFLTGSIADRFSLRAPYALAAVVLWVAFVFTLAVREPHPITQVVAAGEGGKGQLRALPRLVWRDASGLVRRVFTRQAARTSAPDVHGANLPLAPLLVSAFLWSLVTGAVYAVWPNYMVTELGYSQTATSRLWSLASLSELPLMIAAGWLSDRMGRLPVLCLGFVAWTLVFAGYVLTPGMPWIAAVQLIRGFAFSAYTAVAMTYAAEVRSRSQRGMVSGLYSAAGGLGMILGSSLGGVQTQWMGFRPTIGTHAVFVFGGAAYLAVVMARSPALARRAAAPQPDAG